MSNEPVPAGRRARVSMHDVARRAGVSAQTVSRVSNGAANVVPRTRDAVLRAMGELGYRPNGAARALRSGHFRTIGVVTFSLVDTGTVRTLEAISAAASARGYAITLVPVSPTGQNVRGALAGLGELDVDAVVAIMDRRMLDAPALGLPAGVPVAVADAGVESSLLTVDSDQYGGAVSAVEHLLDLGHATVHHVAGPADSHAARRREQAWRDTLTTRGRVVPEPSAGDWSASSGRAAGADLAGDPACSAVFAANDQMALGVLTALHEAGRRVPDEVSVVGFDDVPDAAGYWPPLTTVGQDFREIGRRLVDGVLDELWDPDAEPRRETVETTLVLRGSSGPAPGGAGPTGARNPG